MVHQGRYKTIWRELKEFIISDIIKMQNSKHKKYDKNYIKAFVQIYDKMTQKEKELEDDNYNNT